MNRRGRLLVCCVLFLSVFFNPYTWGENKNIQKNGEIQKRISLERKTEHAEEYLTRIQGEVKKTLKEKTFRHSIKPEFAHIDPDFDNRAPKDEKVIFTQNFRLEKKKLKTRLDVKLGKTRKLTQITKEISFGRWKVRYDYNAQKKIHSFKGNAEIAGFDAHAAIHSKQKPALSMSRPIKISKSINVVPSGNCNFENKNIRFGLTGNVNKYFTASVFMNRSPGFSKIEYSFNGSIWDVVDIRFHGRTVCRQENSKRSRATHAGTLIKKLGKHLSIQAGLQYENATITNPSFSFVYSKTF